MLLFVLLYHILLKQIELGIIMGNTNLDDHMANNPNHD